MKRRFLREVARAGLPEGPGQEGIIEAEEIDELPEPAQRYFRFMGAVGRRRDWAFRVGWTGRFRPRLDQPWRECEAWQYNTALDVARIFHIQIRYGGVLSVIGRDTLVRGRGRMLIRVLDLFTVEDATGPEYALGELVTYLNDALFFAPSMLLVPEVDWLAVDDSSFDVSLTERGQTVTARVFVDGDGAPRDFSTTDRYCADPYDPKHRLIRGRWSTPIDGWQVIEGRPLPARGRAIWQFQEGPFEYAELRPVRGTFAVNVKPGE